ncbi:MAG TPA: hypothetical protein VE910_04370 [Dongiaceae bacterium]|nr:hypothetical protein [Dongiaceae bacterium]
MKDETLDPKRQTLIAALYGELDAEELGKFQALLDEDAALRAEWEELREARALLETAAVNEPAYTPEFVFIDRSQKEAKAKRRFSWLPSLSPAWGFASVAACLAILMSAGLRMDRVENGLVLRFGPAPVPQQTAPAQTVTPSETKSPLTTPISPNGVRVEPTAQALTRDDLNQYSERMLGALTQLVGDAQDRQRKEFADLMGRFYEEMSGEQQRKYQSIMQRVDGMGLGLRYEQQRTNQQISWLTDQVKGTPPDSTLTTPRNPNKDK